MNDLALITPETSGALSVAEVESVLEYAASATAESTRVAYNQDMHQFRIWCTARNACPLPAAPAVLCAYIAHLADNGRKAAGIGRVLAAISWHHRQAGIENPPTAHAGVKQTMKGIRRRIGTAPTKKHAATADIVMRMLAHCPDTLIGKRDRALIAVGMAGAFRRSELVALTTDDIEHTKEGVLITIRRSKTDQESVGQIVSLPHGHHIRPVEALTQWIEAAGITSGILFRAVRLGGVLADPLAGDAVARIVKKLIARAGIDCTDFSGHSLRSGFLSSAAEHKADVFAMQRQSRHKSLDVLSGYVQSKNLFVGHAGAGFL